MMFPFKSKMPVEAEPTPPSDVEVIRAKIAACDAEIARAEDELRSISLAAALSDDPEAGKEAIAKLTELRARKDLLSDALRAAQEVERANADRLSEREYQARRRSLAQKVGQIGRDADTLSRALADTRDAFRRLVGSAEGILALLPPSLRIEGYERLLGAGHLRQLSELEASRLCEGGVLSPGARQLVVCANRDEQGIVTPMTEILAGIVGAVRTEFDRCGPVLPTACQQKEITNA
jgi:hypothetical protein